jgi:uridine kinase
MGTVVSISSISGGGKTTLIEALHNTFKNSEILSFDDYASSNRWYPEWLEPGGDRLSAAKAWRKEGCDPDRVVSTPKLAIDIAERAGKSRGFVFIEEPFGRLRSEISPMINVSIHIETPLDVALARKVVRNASLQEPAKYLQMYLDTGLRILYIAANNAKQVADLVIDGTKSQEHCFDLAYTFLHEI